MCLDNLDFLERRDDKEIKDQQVQLDQLVKQDHRVRLAPLDIAAQ